MNHLNNHIAELIKKFRCMPGSDACLVVADQLEEMGDPNSEIIRHTLLADTDNSCDSMGCGDGTGLCVGTLAGSGNGFGLDASGFHSGSGFGDEVAFAGNVNGDGNGDGSGDDFCAGGGAGYGPSYAPGYGEGYRFCSGTGFGHGDGGGYGDGSGSGDSSRNE